MVKKLNLLLIVLLGISGCAGVSDSYPTRDLPGTSPTKVVDGFLEALKKDDFGKAYEFVFTPFSDKEGYVLRMKNLVEDYGTNILDYRILGTQIFGDLAVVVAELDVRFKPVNSDREVEKKIRNQYDLSIIEDNWRITSDKCILNCLTPEDFDGQAKY